MSNRCCRTEACNLGSINLARIIRPDRAELDWEKLRQIIPLAVRFLDNVVDLTHYPTERILRHVTR